MLAYLRYLAINYVYQDLDSIPSHEFLNLLTSEHLETFQAAFSSLNTTLNEIEEADENDGTVVEAPRLETPQDDDATPPREEEERLLGENDQTQSPPKPGSRTGSAEAGAPDALPGSGDAGQATQYDSPSRSDEGYGSNSGESIPDRAQDHEHDETSDEIAALGIIEEDDEVPDYGVALEPATYNSISPLRQKTVRRSSQVSADRIDASPRTSPTRARLAELTGPTPRAKRLTSTRGGMSDNARHLLSIGYTLSLMGEKLDKTRSVEGSVKSVIIKASQAIEKSQAGSVHGKSRYGGSKYGGSRYAGSKFGGSKRSVARSIVLEENLPAWGF
ncbi:protein of unknown function [Taphrina deformans PYCC 5710]|uniref:Uncharacterized protein n=1 Tax=Taphrina deformans (strain PYCC 5710 / ATCC 11124 / CBS 356.35 / IMI 108563 / JCM 9778 / NBRC 8474) TaxID=1097556 RepID=R4XAC3_TAPDE|nr:protein of unknown function [Taphrina deformans PYCC 5710]|eukprot:CCG82758.1 protein of unknown function [Taphrina deformans PYCC 5710]